jgi:hypothetical protein
MQLLHEVEQVAALVARVAPPEPGPVALKPHPQRRMRVAVEGTPEVRFSSSELAWRLTKHFLVRRARIGRDLRTQAAGVDITSACCPRR